jgi:hypothetical protein
VQVSFESAKALYVKISGIKKTAPESGFKIVAET